MFRKPYSAMLMAVLAAAPLGAAPAPSRLPPVLVSRTLFAGSPPIAADVLALHNAERRAADVPDLVWDDKLAQEAQTYAHELARLGQMRHSAAPTRPGQGENLWMGTRDYFSPANMVGAWASERTMFRPARFPDVSTTGNWAHVGHYTQMIWPGTQRVGCSLSRGAQADFLVCRYFPAGNVMGSPVP
ncbi:MAG: CAP domain-containing protein [Sphingomonas bacterium]|nr:CAP domain-containing protein [Sphingomonas bacterium]